MTPNACPWCTHFRRPGKCPPGLHRFTFARMEPHTRTDGSRMELSVWIAPCRDCGDPFEVKAPPPDTPGFERTKAFGRVRCDAHKRTPARWLAQ